MKFYLILAFLGVWAFEIALRPQISVLVEAQNWNISRTFKPIEFEWTHRGSFNMSYCSRELVNCYDYFQLQIVCSQNQKFDSICAVMFHNCNDLYGDHWDYKDGRLEIQDAFCPSNYEWTR